MTIHLDISQLVLDPRRTGIQRAERELIRHWPGPAPLIPCRFDVSTEQLVELPTAIFDILCADAPPGGPSMELGSLQPYLQGKPVQPHRLLNAELFVEPARARFYEACHQRCRRYWLVYDFLPWLHPEWFSTGSAARLMHYLHALRSIDDVAFISAGTRNDYSTRVGRQPVCGPVIPMGSDGLDLEMQSFDPDRIAFVMLGTLEPRKNAAPVMQAFEWLWQQGADARLVMIGATSPDAPAELEMLERLAGDPRFTHLRDLPDGGVRQALRGARALLFPSEGEGYGIPPMEALHAGIPVVVSAGLPALQAQPALGQIRLDIASVETIAAAVMELLDNGRCQQLWDEAARMPVPGWADFAAGVAAWVQA